MLASVVKSTARSSRTLSGINRFPEAASLVKKRQPSNLSIGQRAPLSTSQSKQSDKSPFRKPNQDFTTALMKATEIVAARGGPGAFGWQVGAEAATHLGLADPLYMSLLPAIGDGVGVVTGSILFYSAKQNIAPELNERFETRFSIPTKNEIIGNATMYGIAATASGAVWQPAVDTLQSLSYTFSGTSLVTGLICGFTFNKVLTNISRPLVSKLYPEVAPSKESKDADKHVSIAIGGGAAGFVLTDPSAPIPHLIATDDPLTNCIKAATSFGGGLMLGYTASSPILKYK
ncbi:MAG: hypothetical protein CL503_00015 [Actinobacteria bacterium]|nr:hypothetical protein [Actinomycetota bacterium]|tara:strand:+ start:3641 stop:4507 length:867 start_codon:yes stop_codon:yes gene_type:complete